ncbi:MAG TPA: pseudouridine synthase [Eubacteriales bacterium]|nr:pseudouridine synthase [Eubacteriales bacterium]
MRINKYLADCGVASRRSAEQFVKDGRVKVNGKVELSLSTDISERDSVTLDNKTIKPKNKLYYIMLHKPKGFVTTVKDDLGRKTVMDLIDIKARLFPVGRLDYDTEGLLILTNDGNLTNLLTHPSHKITKTYVARVSGMVKEPEIKMLTNGVKVEGKIAKAISATVLEGDVHTTKVEIIISEGRNHQVKNMFEAIGKPVEFLKRTAIGEIRLGGLTRGTYRDLNEKELAYLKTLD